MSYIILSMLNNNRGPSRPLTPGERRGFAITIAAIVVLGSIGMYFAVQADNRDEARQKQFQQAWDGGQYQPAEAVRIDAGKEANVPTTRADLRQVLKYGHSCQRKYCDTRDVHRHPMAFPLDNLHLGSECFVSKPSNRVGSLMAVTNSTSAAYRVSFDGSGQKFTICLSGTPGDGDKLFIWSNDPQAVR
jgi:hypothetical protein